MINHEGEKGTDFRERAKGLLAEMEKIAKKQVALPEEPKSPDDEPVISRKRRFFSGKGKDPVDREATLVFQRLAITVVVILTLYVVGFGYLWLLMAVLALYGVFWLASVRSRKKALADQLNPAETISVGTYISGFSRIRQSFLRVECLITDSDFVFACQDGEELGRIPRNAVSRVGVKEGDRILQHLALLRMVSLTLTSLVLRGRARHPYHLLIDWRSDMGRQFTVFEFTGPQAARDAYHAVNILYRHLKPRHTSG